MSTLVIQDAFEPYYAGRKAVALSFAKAKQDRRTSAKTGHDQHEGEQDRQEASGPEKQAGKHDA